METPETQLREIQLALEYCDLDYEEILEDYREHLKNRNSKTEKEDSLKHS
ncbi:hypothetical protein KKA14_05375 [bacterium]|nr:hypothetical protein [bacterium]